MKTQILCRVLMHGAFLFLYAVVGYEMQYKTGMHFFCASGQSK